MTPAMTRHQSSRKAKPAAPAPKPYVLWDRSRRDRLGARIARLRRTGRA
jgi:hypothetical protein